MAVSERPGDRSNRPRRAAGVVVVPARDEEERIGACLDALAAQVEIDPAAYEAIARPRRLRRRHRAPG